MSITGWQYSNWMLFHVECKTTDHQQKKMCPNLRSLWFTVTENADRCHPDNGNCKQIMTRKLTNIGWWTTPGWPRWMNTRITLELCQISYYLMIRQIGFNFLHVRKCFDLLSANCLPNATNGYVSIIANMDISWKYTFLKMLCDTGH